MSSIPYRTAGNAAAKRVLTPTAACSSDTNLSSTIMRMTGMTDRRPKTHPWFEAQRLATTKITSMDGVQWPPSQGRASAASATTTYHSRLGAASTTATGALNRDLRRTQEAHVSPTR